MDINNNLIIFKGEDITEKLASCVFDVETGRWQITYVGSGKIYNPNRANLTWHKNPAQIAPDSVALYIQGKLQTDIKSILDFGPYVRLIFQYIAPKIYQKKEISFDTPISKEPNAAAVLDYLKQVSAFVSLKDENDQSFLRREYDKMVAIHRDSVFSSYLAKNNPFKRKSPSHLIYPFGFNLSQKDAVKNAFSSSISMIEGPPGTGKTQTILNIIANAVINNQTVAVVSK